MKTRFSSLDIIAIVPELKNRICTGWRVNQIYDCDNKTYLFKLNKSIVKMKKDDDPVSVDEETANKMTFIIESGVRIHSTDFDWPKSHAPSGFATKLRKHLCNKRIEDLSQVGSDRLIDIQFGSGIAANHLIIELYDRGNLILTDSNYNILTILRWRKMTEKDNSEINLENGRLESENFKVGDIYPIEDLKKSRTTEALDENRIIDLLKNSEILLSNNHKKRNKLKQQKDNPYLEINLKDLLNPHVVYGSSLLEDKLLNHITKDGKPVKKCFIQIPKDTIGKLDETVIRFYAKQVHNALQEADLVFRDVRERNKSPGYIVQKKQKSSIKKTSSKKNNNEKDDESTKELITNIDFFPIFSCAQRKIQQESGELSYQEYESFDKAVDAYYCNLESQKIDTKAFGAEKEARKKLENLKIAQEKRLDELSRVQKDDEEKARLIELNSDKVEDALLIIRSMIANQVSWTDIWKTIKDAQAMKDPIALLISSVRFDRNEFTMKLSNPYEVDSDLADDDDRTNSSKQKQNYRDVEIDISLSAYANARRFFVKRRTAVNKEKKTIEVSKKAFKNVERKTKEMLKEVVVKTNITKARKRYWFENFFWFISTDGYLVVAGRDAEQNELLVKRYMKNNDIYVHADLHGASSVIIKNEFSQPVPPKTLNEAGCMAVCYSSAWDSKIATTSWWVYPKQVSKTAPAGEYLTLGAFIIRGKKNYLPLSNLILGFGFLFRLGEESIERRRENRLEREQNRKQDEIDEQEADDASDTDEQSLSGSASSKDDLTSKELSQEVGELDKEAEEKVLDVNDDYEEEEDDDLLENKIVEHRLIDTLTESPLGDDVLLYAIPMCGPYSALQSFKFKVKVIPGANKRGKAAKACLGLFLHDKKTNQRERDLLRALKDQDYARNIPNKVKISSTNMKTMTKRRPKKSEVFLLKM